jgi:hypothetical protein
MNNLLQCCQHMWRLEKTGEYDRELSNLTLEFKVFTRRSISIYFLSDRNNPVWTPIPVDPAGGHRYWTSIKTCES